jgi:hypothetical protein
LIASDDVGAVAYFSPPVLALGTSTADPPQPATSKAASVAAPLRALSDIARHANGKALPTLDMNSSYFHGGGAVDFR